jgi:HAE1 family hydrophobic/amphiphilic exporter-1
MAMLGQPTTDAEGVRATFTGQNEEQQEATTDIGNSMIVGLVLIFGILVIQFNSFRQAVVVLLAVPLSFVGVIFGMWVTKNPFSMASFIGLVCLAGIVVNDAIVLVDFANQARRRGMRVKHALLEAGVNRLRPVLLTTVTTIGGLLPLFLNVSGGAEFWQPLTGAVIFGLAFASVLTLVVIPVGYSLVYNWADRTRAAGDPAPATPAAADGV